MDNRKSADESTSLRQAMGKGKGATTAFFEMGQKSSAVLFDFAWILALRMIHSFFIEPLYWEIKCRLQMTSLEIASETLENHIAANPYPGRGLIVGKSLDDSHWQLVYFIMGRSPNSRNRQFAFEGGTLETRPFDESKVEDSSLIIYEAMLEFEKAFFVSNGDQTRTLHDGWTKGESMKEALGQREREPDAPNYTPRITGMVDFSKTSPEIGLSILKANKIDPQYTDQHCYFPSPPSAGVGYGLTTYMGDGNPLPTFLGDPLLLPIEATPEDTLERYWKALDEDNRISIAVKKIASDGSSSSIVIRNKYV